MIAVLNQVLGYIEEHLTEEIDVAAADVIEDRDLLTTAVRFGMAPPKHSTGPSERCMASAPAMRAETVAPFAHNHSSGSA